MCEKYELVGFFINFPRICSLLGSNTNSLQSKIISRIFIPRTLHQFRIQSNAMNMQYFNKLFSNQNESSSTPTKSSTLTEQSEYRIVQKIHAYSIHAKNVDVTTFSATLFQLLLFLCLSFPSGIFPSSYYSGQYYDAHSNMFTN